eukprot:4735864-Pyramimonas_sp.AAC.1
MDVLGSQGWVSCGGPLVDGPPAAAFLSREPPAAAASPSPPVPPPCAWQRRKFAYGRFVSCRPAATPPAAFN